MNQEKTINENNFEMYNSCLKKNKPNFVLISYLQSTKKISKNLIPVFF